MEDMHMTDFTISPKAENVWLESWLDLSPEEQQEMDHIEQDEQCDARFFRFEDSVYDIADFMRDDRFPDWHAGYPLYAFAMLMIRVDGSGDTIDVGLLH
nr:ABC transporter [Cronobacter sakazakii]